MPDRTPGRADDSRLSHVVEDQTDVFAFLADPAAHGCEGPVRRIDTHSAVVFLAGSDAYKAKRAVRFPFLDFSTLEKRRVNCLAEVEINAPGAPGLYRGVVPVTRGPGGRLVVGGAGPVVEWLVAMNRFPDGATLDRVAERGDLTRAMLTDVVHRTIELHGRAPRRDGGAFADEIGKYLAQNREAFAENAHLFPAGRAETLVDRSVADLARLRPLILERGTRGLVVRGHGDLHLRNIVLLDGRPTLFDAVEFDEGIATTDVLYDLGFLLMDLWERGLREEANHVLNRWLWLAPDADPRGLALLPLYLSVRATIRAKVLAAGAPAAPTAERRATVEAEAIRYFEAAETFLEPVPPVLVAFGGLSGAGKTTVAARLAHRIGRPPGAAHLRSDVIRKRLAGVDITEHLPAEAYTPEAGRRVYEALDAACADALAAGSSVLVDAVHARPDERDRIEAVAESAGVRFVGIWLEAPPPLLTDRVAHRTDDASDATPDVVALQLGYDLGAISWTRIDASGPLDAVVDAVAAGCVGTETAA